MKNIVSYILFQSFIFRLTDSKIDIYLVAYAVKRIKSILTIVTVSIGTSIVTSEVLLKAKSILYNPSLKFTVVGTDNFTSVLIPKSVPFLARLAIPCSRLIFDAMLNSAKHTFSIPDVLGLFADNFDLLSAYSISCGKKSLRTIVASSVQIIDFALSNLFVAVSFK